MRSANHLAHGLAAVFCSRRWRRSRRSAHSGNAAQAQAQADPLPSWNDGADQSVDHRVRRARHDARRPGLRARRPAHRHLRQRRHAVVRAADVRPARVRARPREGAGAAAPEWKTKQPFKAVLDGDMKALAASGEKGLVEIIAATHAGMTTTSSTRSSPTGSRPRAIRGSSGPTPSWSTSRCWSCSPICAPTASRPSSSPAAASSSCGRGPSGSTAFRPSRWSAPRSRRRFEMRDGRPVLFRLPEINFIDDKAGKPVGINEHIGRRPIVAFGNSDGDLEMLQWTTMAERRALRPDRPSHRCRARIRLRPQVALRQARQGAGRRGGEQVDRGRHEEGLEARCSRSSERRRYRGTMRHDTMSDVLARRETEWPGFARGL